MAESNRSGADRNRQTEAPACSAMSRIAASREACRGSAGNASAFREAAAAAEEEEDDEEEEPDADVPAAAAAADAAG